MIPRLEPPYKRSTPRKPPRRYRSESERRRSEPWRRSGYGAEYRARRQAVIEAARGRCQRCGRAVAVRTSDGWRMNGGEVHHVRPLAEGGHDGDLVLLCVRCHRAADAALRRRRRG